MAPRSNSPLQKISDDVVVGADVTIQDFVNLYGCRLGDETSIGPFVEIQRNVTVGKRCKIQSHTFVCEGVTIDDDVFIGHGVMFTNDLFPRASTDEGRPQSDEDWEVVGTHVRRGASIGSGATIVAGTTIGEGALVGAGAVVTRDVAPGAVVSGVPARAHAPAADPSGS